MVPLQQDICTNPITSPLRERFDCSNNISLFPQKIKSSFFYVFRSWLLLNPPDAESGKEWQTWKRGFGNPFFISCKKCRDHQKYWHNFTQLIVYGQSPSTPAACVHRDTLPALESDMTSFRHSCGPHMRRGKGTIDQGGRRKSRLTWLLSWPSNWEGRPKAEPWMWGGVMVVESAPVTLPFSWMQCLRSPCPLLFSCLPACLSQSRFVHEKWSTISVAVSASRYRRPW